MGKRHRKYVDEKIKQKAYELFEKGLINEIEIGTTNSRIHFRRTVRLCLAERNVIAYVL